MKAETQEPLLIAIMRDRIKLHVFILDALAAVEVMSAVIAERGGRQELVVESKVEDDECEVMLAVSAKISTSSYLCTMLASNLLR